MPQQRLRWQHTRPVIPARKLINAVLPAALGSEHWLAPHWPISTARGISTDLINSAISAHIGMLRRGSGTSWQQEVIRKAR